jgi:predicted N-acetyltransferase YhbS
MGKNQTGDLTRGVRGAARTRIRQARPGDDRDQLRDLCRMATGEGFGDYYLPLGEHAGQALALDGVPRHAAAGMPSGMGIEEAMERCAVGLVAEDRSGTIVGAAFASPVMACLDLADAGRVEAGSRLLVTVAKLAVLAVDPDRRGEGIGASLVRQTREVYTRSGYASMIAEISADDEALATFYGARGFEVLEPDDGVILTPIVGFEMYQVTRTPQERYILRKLNDAYEWPLRKTNARAGLASGYDIASLR